MPAATSEARGHQDSEKGISAPKRADPPSAVELRGNAAVREPSVARARRTSGGTGGRSPFAATGRPGFGGSSVVHGSGYGGCRNGEPPTKPGNDR